MVRSGPLYLEGNPTSPVAVCTLSSPELLETLAASPVAEQAAITGPLETENIGIERMLITLLERPSIRWLVLCGDETRGRYQGQALQCVFAHGVGPEGEILHARSRRARLPTLRAKQVEVARRQVRLRDLSGVHDVEAIAEAVADCLAQPVGPFNERVDLPRLEPIAVASRRFRLTEADPAGFFLILVDAPRRQLVVEHYGSDGVPRHRLVGPDAESLCAALVEGQLVSRLDHAAYLGRELAKAEFALKFGRRYRQDESL